MLINKHIGFDESEGMGVDGSLFQQELLALDAMGKRRIQVWINSPGGIVMDGYNIYNAILKSKTKVDTYNVGIAASIAAVIFQAGRTRYMADYAKLMYHNPYGGNSKELGVLKDSIAVMVCERTGKDKDSILKIMDRTTWISASEALADNFCDTVEYSSNQNKKRMVSTEPKAMWIECTEILNSLLPNKNEKPMLSKVTNKLGLIDGSNEDTILAAITQIQNKAEQAEAKAADLENKLNEKEAEKKEVESKLTNATNKLQEVETAKREAEKQAVEVKAKNMVEGYAKAGRIKNDAETITKWTNLAVTDFDGTEALIKDLPVHKTAQKIDISEVSNTANLTNVIAKTMAEARTKHNL